MKLSLTFLALAVATVQADLSDKWNLDFIGSDRDENGVQYSFTYGGFGSEITLAANMKSSVTKGDCSGGAFATNDYGTEATKESPVDALAMSYDADTDTATVLVDMQTKVAEFQGDLWEADGSDGSGVMSYCVRFGLFSGTNEVNYSETVVTLTVTMEEDVALESFDVAEKDKTANTQTQEYSVTAALCSTGTGVDPAGAFLQGALVCVQVTPSSADVEVTSISSFVWTNLGDDNSGSEITQTALPLAGGDGLTSYTEDDKFNSILYASFYESGLQVSGAGIANLGFTAIETRRLGASGSEKNGRVLQTVDATQEFEITADIVKSVDSPTALQTAGGATASFVVTIVGLVGAVLLA